MKFVFMKVSGTPCSAQSMAGARTRPRGMLPKRSRAAIQPPTGSRGGGGAWAPPRRLFPGAAPAFRGGGPRADEVEHVTLGAPASRDEHQADAARARHEGLAPFGRRAPRHRRVHGVAALE